MEGITKYSIAMPTTQYTMCVNYIRTRVTANRSKGEGKVQRGNGHLLKADSLV